jgi:hypothetical protein
MDGPSIKTILLSDEQWRTVDALILRGWTINAIKAIREAAGLRIPEAADLVEQRRCWLQEKTPGEFVFERRFHRVEVSKPAEPGERGFDEFNND